MAVQRAGRRRVVDAAPTRVPGRDRHRRRHQRIGLRFERTNCFSLAGLCTGATSTTGWRPSGKFVAAIRPASWVPGSARSPSTIRHEAALRHKQYEDGAALVSEID